jgi:hypothetical protein
MESECHSVELCEGWKILNKGISTYSECQAAEFIIMHPCTRQRAKK